MALQSRPGVERSTSPSTILQPPYRPLAIDRRRFLAGALALTVGGGLANTTGLSPAYAQEDDEDVLAPGPAEAPGILSASGAQVFSLAAGSGGPLGEGVTRNKYKAEIGYARYEDDTFVLGLHPGDKELGRSEWISRRIGKFS